MAVFRSRIDSAASIVILRCITTDLTVSCLLRPLSAQIRGAGVATEKVLRAREGDGPGWQDFSMDEIPGAVWACGVSVSARASVF